MQFIALPNGSFCEWPLLSPHYNGRSHYEMQICFLPKTDTLMPTTQSKSYWIKTKGKLLFEMVVGVDANACDDDINETEIVNIMKIYSKRLWKHEGSVLLRCGGHACASRVCVRTFLHSCMCVCACAYVYGTVLCMVPYVLEQVGN